MVIEWVKNDPVDRLEHLHKLLVCINLSSLPIEYLRSTVDKETLIINDPSCKFSLKIHFNL